MSLPTSHHQPHLVDVLRGWHRRCPLSDDDLVFPSRSGSPLDLDTFRARVFKPAVARAGLAPTVRFHDLRHTAASLLLQHGATVRDVMEICGWRQLATAQRYLQASATLGDASSRLSDARDAALQVPAAQPDRRNDDRARVEAARARGPGPKRTLRSRGRRRRRQGPRRGRERSAPARGLRAQARM